MASVVSPDASPPVSIAWTVADLVDQLGGVATDRIHLIPPPGTATEDDVVAAEARGDRICELIDGTLVEKVMGAFESRLAAVLIHLLQRFLEKHPLGAVIGEAGTLRILPNQVRAPDVSFLAWTKFPGGKFPRTPVPAVVPDLAVEFLSKGNSPGEMERKLRDYFAAGVRLVWYIDPRTRTARVYTSPEACTVIDETQTLSGGDVLPGFKLTLGELFAEADG